MRVQDPVRAAEYRLFAATTLEAVRRGLEKLAKDLQAYGDPALRGSGSFFQLAETARAKAIKQFGEAETDVETRQAAERAWSTGDFCYVAETFGRIVDRLSAAERRRLDYARKRLSA